MTLFGKLTQPEPTRNPPTLAEVFNEASGSSAIVFGELDHQAARLVDANVALDDVVMRAGSEMESLRQLRDAAIDQRRRNSEALKCITSALHPEPETR